MNVSQHPAWTDPSLPDWPSAACQLCPDGEVVEILRHLPGRRVTAKITTPTGPAVLKVFSHPRARGNDRRLRLLAASRATGVVPAARWVDATGHIGLVEFIEGRPLTHVPVTRLPAASEAAGRALAMLHRSGVVLDRSWSIDQEKAQLRKLAGRRTTDIIESLLRQMPQPSEEPFISAHRDCHPAQAIAAPDGTVRWADLDDAAMAPASIDVGNFVGHVTRQQILGEWTAPVAAAVREAFLRGYGPPPVALAAWERLSLARLLALADTRHDSPGEILALTRILADHSQVIGRVSGRSSSLGPR